MNRREFVARGSLILGASILPFGRALLAAAPMTIDLGNVDRILQA